MKAGVIGCGSIGLRHLANLRSLGITDIVAFDPSPEALDRATAGTDLQTTLDLDHFWNAGPNVVFVTSPTSLHARHALETIRHGCHMFLEKPISHDWAGVQDVIEETGKRNLIGSIPAPPS
jgi:predicted dehydrogenase